MAHLLLSVQAVSPPRGIFREVDLFVTRRARGRQMRLRPGKSTNNIVGYVVAVISRRFKVEIYAICVMSDHWHVVLHDRRGKIEAFTRLCHSLIARAINHRFGDEESLWNSQQTNQPRLLTPADVLSRIAYTMANPVKHGAVMYARSWPGLRRAFPARPMTFKRPRLFQDLGVEGLPEFATLELSRPRGFEHVSDNELALAIRNEIEETEARFRAERAEANLGYIGRRAVLAQSRHARATSKEKKPRRRPTVICANRQLREEALLAERTWRVRYAERLARWCGGERDVAFPFGTYKMRVLHGVNVDPPPG